MNGKHVDGGRVPPRGTWGVIYWGVPPEGVAITLEVASTGLLKLRLVDQSHELPRLAQRAPRMQFTPRPPYTMPALVENFTSIEFGDATFVSKAFTL